VGTFLRQSVCRAQTALSKTALQIAGKYNTIQYNTKKFYRAL